MVDPDEKLREMLGVEGDENTAYVLVGGNSQAAIPVPEDCIEETEVECDECGLVQTIYGDEDAKRICKECGEEL